MKNYSKMTLFAFLALSLLFLTSTVDAYSYNTYTYTDRDSFSYREDLAGNNQGFTLSDESNSPIAGMDYTYCGYYDWSAYGKRCARTRSYGYYGDRPYYPDHAYYNKDAVLKEAFKTYQQSRRDETKIRMEELRLEQRRQYDGYRYRHGYGYSGVSYYQYGW